MKYHDLIVSLSRKTKKTHKEIREILEALPEVLLELQAGEKVQTPIGTFVAKHRKKREILLPDGIEMGAVPEQITIQLRTGCRLKISPGDTHWGRMVSPASKRET